MEIAMMTGSYSYPVEYGTEHGDRCGRGYDCPGTMRDEEDPCFSPLCEGTFCTCPVTFITVCNVCGESDDF
jgi:hypothetical protein